jgi:hypothetical protein
MVLLLGYGYRLDPVLLRNSLQGALQAFPHLNARIQFSLDPLQAELVPSFDMVQIEWVKAGAPAPRNFELLDQQTLLARFAPSSASEVRSPLQALQDPLLQLRLTWLAESDRSVLGVMASHMVLDGTGLALFLDHLTATIQGRTPPTVVHDRRHTFSASLPADQTLPAHYHEITDLTMAMAQEQDPLTAVPATVFSVAVQNLEENFLTKSASDRRLYFAAQLCQEVAKHQTNRETMALWCNSRGLGQVPRNYTGNAGCYVHLPLGAGDPHVGYRHLKHAISRKGFAETAQTYARVKANEAAGRLVFWNGPKDELLSLNLVPHVPNVANFGKGDPTYAQILTRNVSGLRLFNTPDGNRMVVEASLPRGIGSALVDRCRDMGLSVELWHKPDSFRTDA